jgi:hypothetical protein
LLLLQSIAEDLEVATGYGLSPPSRKKRWAVVAAKLPVVHDLAAQGLLAAQVDGEKTSLQALAPDSPNLMSLAEPNRWALRDMSQIRSSAAEKLA